jgi:histidine triad (HIT) family protein
MRMNVKDCIFCRIVKDEARHERVYEDGFSLAFLDAKPITRGHTLVVPKRHVEGLLDLSPGERAMFIESIAATCRIIERLSPHYNVGCNRGEFAGQIIFHLHVHVIPRYGEERSIFNRRMLISPEDERKVLRDMGLER